MSTAESTLDSRNRRGIQAAAQPMLSREVGDREPWLPEGEDVGEREHEAAKCNEHPVAQELYLAEAHGVAPLRHPGKHPRPGCQAANGRYESQPEQSPRLRHRTRHDRISP